MTRYLLCEKCNTGFYLHPEDSASGYKIRKVWIRAHKPADHFIKINSERINLPSLLCDTCNKRIADNEAVIAVTMWRGRVQPANWESEYGVPA